MSTEADQQVVARSLCAGRPVLSRLRRHDLADDVTWVLRFPHDRGGISYKG